MDQPIIIQQPEPRIMRDPIRVEKRYRMKVRVNVHSTSVYQATPESGNHLLSRGEHEIVAYESQVPLIMAKVETRQDEIERAKEVVRRLRRTAMAHAMEGQGPNLYGWQDVDPLEYGSPKNPDLRRVFRASDGIESTVEGEFARAVGRPILPLTKADRLEELPPLRSDDEKRTIEFAEIIGRTLGAGNGDGRVMTLLAKLEEQQGQIEALKKMVADQLAAPTPPAKNGRDAK